MSGGIFISYRRGDSAGFAGRIYDRVANRLNRERVFFDVDNIELGADFVRVLSDRVGECDALVAIIGRDWLSATDEENRRRLDDPDDFVRIEIETALRRDIPVIPVLVDGAAMPRKESLPEPLKPLARRQGLGISHERFDADSERLTKALAFVEEARRKREQAVAELEERQREEAARRAEEDRRKAEAEAAQRAEDERRRREEAQAAKQADEDRRTAKAEENQRAEEEKWPARVVESVRFIGLPRPRSGSANWRLIAAVAGAAIIVAPAFFIARHSVRQHPVLIGDSGTSASSRADDSEAAAAASPKSNLPQAPAGSGGSKKAAPIRVDMSEAVVAAISPKANLTALPPISVDDDPLVKECDRLAADPMDKSRPAGVRGVYIFQLDAASAISACRAALARFPSSARLQFELGQALVKTGADEEAFAVLKRAADDGYAAAQVDIGELYRGGSGVKQDYAQALTWYQKAADQGYADAQYWIGWLYEYGGYGVKQDYAQAMAWYRKAADQGDTPAQFHIGWLYEHGNGVKQNVAEAKAWYQKAADQGDLFSKYGLERLTK